MLGNNPFPKIVPSASAVLMEVIDVVVHFADVVPGIVPTEHE